MKFSIGNAQHIGARQQQQDSFGFSDPGDEAFVAHGGFLGIVADGVGGLTHGSEASQSAVRTFIEAYHRKTPHESIPQALSRSLLEANAAVLRVTGEPSGEGAGTTLAAAVLHEGSLHWISAGDSRVYLLHGSRLTRVTADHTFARQLDEQAAQGIISRAAARQNSERGSLTSYLGQSEPKEVDKNARSLALAPDDSVIVCSDGFYRALDDSEIVGAFRNDLQQACESLVGQAVAKQRKGQDNMTVISLKQTGVTDKLFAHDHRVRQVTLASVLALLALTAMWSSYRYHHRYQRHSAGTDLPVPQVTPTPANQGENAGTKTDAMPERSAPAQTSPAQANQEAITNSHSPASQERPRKSKGNHRRSSARKATPPGAAQHSPVGSTQPLSPSHSAPEGTAAAPVAQPPATEPAPASPQVESPEKTAPPATPPANNPEKPPAAPPPTTDNKPDGPPNIALEKINAPTFGTRREIDSRNTLEPQLEI